MSPEVSQETTKPMSPENFAKMEYEEQKEAFATGYLRRVNEKESPVSCGDGREALEAKIPFIKLFGGTFGAALAVVVDEIDSNPATDILDTARETYAKLNEKGYTMGDHRDDHEHSDDDGGCGFADNLGKIIDTASRTEDFGETLDGVFRKVWGNFASDNQAELDEVLQGFRTLNANNDSDDGETIPTGRKIVDDLANSGGEVLTLTGEHRENAIIFNYVEGTTISTNELVKDGGSAFVIDVWYALKLADELGIEQTKAKLIFASEWVATALVLASDENGELPPIFHITDEYLKEIGLQVDKLEA